MYTHMRRFLKPPTISHRYMQMLHNKLSYHYPPKSPVISSNVKNLDLPICKECVHFINSDVSGPEFGKCKLFGEKNMVTGEIEYSYAQLCRKDEMYRCGSPGFFYKAAIHDIVTDQ